MVPLIDCVDALAFLPIALGLCAKGAAAELGGSLAIMFGSASPHYVAHGGRQYLDPVLRQKL